jgi:predicted DNA-binding transcriptional regulator YafY
MRASRLLSVLLLLQSRGRMTAAELAAELEVSVRTIYRDVDSLSEAGVPVYADRGTTGGFQLLDGYSTKLTGLTETEAQSLLFSGIPGAATELGLGEVLAAAQLKLDAAMPVGLRSRTDDMRSRFLLDPQGWFRSAEEVPHLVDIAAAVWESRRIQLRYRRWGGDVVRRTLNPLGLVLKAGAWYLVATARSGEPRMYRVSRVRRFTLLAQDFQRPPDFDLAGFWSARESTLTARLYSDEAVVRLSPRARNMLWLLGSTVFDAAERSDAVPGEDGWTTLRLPIESHGHAVAAFLQLGAGAEVLSPASLRARLRAEIAALGQLYEPTDGPTTLH